MNENATVAEKPGISPGDIVTILGDNRFTGKQGVVIDTNSDKRPEDGPIAVFFDKEVPDYEFNRTHFAGEWMGGVPTQENYRGCYRVICFPPEELRRDEEFILETLVERKFGSNYTAFHAWNFPLRPGTHACQLESCTSGQPATKITMINVWSSIEVMYTCEACHKEWDGARTDGVTLKKPLPGAP